MIGKKWGVRILVLCIICIGMIVGALWLHKLTGLSVPVSMTALAVTTVIILIIALVRTFSWLRKGIPTTIF